MSASIVAGGVDNRLITGSMFHPFTTLMAAGTVFCGVTSERVTFRAWKELVCTQYALVETMLVKLPLKAFAPVLLEEEQSVIAWIVGNNLISRMCRGNHRIYS